METTIEVNQANLALLSRRLSVPGYDRSKLKAGIVHIGVGGFHRAHQAFYTDALMRAHLADDWGICGVCLLDRDRKMYDVLEQQDGLYTLMIKDPASSAQPAVLGPVIEYYFAPSSPADVIGKIADPSVKIVTLTITEGGYNFESGNNRFQWEEPLVQWDLHHPDNPRTVFGYLTAALRKRSERDLPLTVQSCDNIQKNGDVARRMLTAYVASAAPDLLQWIDANVSFPNSMVDRITPVTTDEDRQLLRQQYGVRDQWPVVTEAFHQWVIEDDFKAGRPQWEVAGARFVQDVDPYEKMKIGLINGGHSLVGLAGYHLGCGYIDEAVALPRIEAFLRRYMDDEVTPVLDPVPGIDLAGYKNQVVRRFGNQYIKDSVFRIIQGSAAKIPKFILPTIIAGLEAGGPVRKCVTVLVCWYQYLLDALTQDRFGDVDDPMKALLQERMNLAVSNPVIFLKTEALFGDLAQSGSVTEAFLDILGRLQQRGMLETLDYELAYEEPGR